MAEIMKAEEARAFAGKFRNELDNKACKKALEKIMAKIEEACRNGQYDIYAPFSDIPGHLIPMLTTRLREFGYVVNFNVGDDGPNRPGHDEVKWKL
jgi:hypothetical protein